MSLKNKSTSKIATPEAEALTPKPQATAAKKNKIILVKLLKGQQFQCPDTKVILKIGQMIPVPEISNWMKFQETVGLLEIIE